LFLIAFLFMFFLVTGFVTGIYFESTKTVTKQAGNKMQYQAVNAAHAYSVALLKTQEVFELKTNLNYNQWSAKLNEAINLWAEAENATKKLKVESNNVIAQRQLIDKYLNNYVYASSAQEIIAVFDSAPAGKKLRTLAKHLGTDAKRARSILKKAQGDIDAPFYNNEEKRLEKLENVWRGLKSGSKIGLYVGGTILSGGATSTAGTILAEAGAIFGGVDLVLEVGEDVSNIAFGYNSEAVALFSGIRKLSEPTATIIGFGNIGASSTFDKLSSFMFGAEQINAAIQENKYMGLAIDFNNMAVKVEGLNEGQAKAWLKEQNISENPGNPELILANVENALVKSISPTLSQNKDNTLSNNEKEEDNLAVKPSGKCNILGKWKLITTVAANSTVNEGADWGEVFIEFFENGVLTATAHVNGETASNSGKYRFQGCEGSIASTTDNADSNLVIKDGKLYQYIKVMGTGLSHKWIYEKVN
jgi:hypothetical protein